MKFILEILPTIGPVSNVILTVAGIIAIGSMLAKFGKKHLLLKPFMVLACAVLFLLNFLHLEKSLYHHLGLKVSTITSP